MELMDSPDSKMAKRRREPAQQEARESEHGRFAHLVVYTQEKGGMGKLSEADKERIARVVYDASKGSGYAANLERQDRKTGERAAAMLGVLSRASAGQLRLARERADAFCLEAQARVRTALVRPRIYVCCDMDMFYAAVELRDDPSLARGPFAVGSAGGVISTASYEARQFGVRSAMPGFIALKLCKNLRLVRVDMPKYEQASREVKAILREYSPESVSGGLDEAYMDITDRVDIEMGSALVEHSTEDRMAFACKLVERMRARVKAETGLSCSAGIAATSMLAKVASDMNKPDGQFAVDASQRGMLAFLHGLPVRKVPGVGKATEKLLKEVLDVHTVGELWERRDRLALAFTQIQSTWLLRVYMCDTESAGATPRGFGSGVGVSSLHDHGAERQSFSIERTFRGEARPAELEARLRELCRDLAAECVEKGAAGRCVTLKLKGANDFQVHSKQISFATAVPRHGAQGADLHEVALPLLKPLLSLMKPPTVRLMGVRVTHLDAKPSASSSSAKTPGPLDKLFARQVAQLSEQERRRLEHEHEPEGQEGNGPHEPPLQLVVDICAEDEHEGGSGSAGDPQASLLCPVCSHALPDDNAAINEHLDSCVLPTASSGEPSKRARTIDDFFRRQAP